MVPNVSRGAKFQTQCSKKAPLSIGGAEESDDLATQSGGSLLHG
ncbi:hypothetical protein [Rhizobium sullae]|nr:hypothetical protein [Rhizobium sullae]